MGGLGHRPSHLRFVCVVEVNIGNLIGFLHRNFAEMSQAGLCAGSVAGTLERVSRFENKSVSQRDINQKLKGWCGMETNQIKRCECFTKMLYHFSVDEILQHLRERIKDVGPQESVRVYRGEEHEKWAQGEVVPAFLTSHCICCK